MNKVHGAELGPCMLVVSCLAVFAKVMVAWGWGLYKVSGLVLLWDLHSGLPGHSFLFLSSRSGWRPRLWMGHQGDHAGLEPESPREPWAGDGAGQDPAEPGPRWGHLGD